MPVLRVTVLDPPRECTGYQDLELFLQVKDAEVPATRTEPGRLVFEVPFEWKVDKLGVAQPSGPAIVREGDGRRFVYLRWYGSKDGHRESFRRIKLFFDDLPPDSLDVTIPGRDAKGMPSCARVRPI